MPSDTIFALSSGHGVAGIAVIRASGPAAGHVAERLGLGNLRPRIAHLRKLSHPETGEPIDTALSLWFPAPRSYTGEDMLELHVHGGRAVVAAVLSAVGRIEGCRLAEPGEFTRRAFSNGAIDLTEAEGLSDLIRAETEAQRRHALRVAGGALRQLYEGWRAQLIEAMALMEAALDFVDEADVAADASAQAQQRASSLRAELVAHLDDQHRGEILRDGFKVVIAGPPNAGKSSLLNALARRDVAIVSPEPGTTRDVLEARLDLGGYPVLVSDTAGIRPDPVNAIEREGIRRSFARSGEADLVLWLTEATHAPLAPPDELAGQAAALIEVRTKADLALPASTDGLAISTKTGEGLAALLERIGQQAAQRLDPGAAASITTARQRTLLREAAAALNSFLTGTPDETELRAEDLRRAAQALGRITGRVDPEDVLDRVFSAFCIGK